MARKERVLTASARPEIQCLGGPAITPYLDDLARLRIAVFRDFPYLYDGDEVYESAYVRAYAASRESLIVLARMAGSVVGASTGMPLSDELDAFSAPFIAAGYDPARIFYGGESVLLPTFRGRGIYREFFAQREAHARRFGFTTFAFCAVERAADHPLRPSAYVPLDAVWRHFGYTEHAELVAHLAWKDIDAGAETEKSLVFWLKSLDTRASRA